MWFWFSLITLICWSFSDLFSKIGCANSNDKNSHLKMVMAVGFVMGLHAIFEIVFNDAVVNLQVIIKYLPVSLLYILSMAIGYLGLRYIELSISSPICNSSGAIVAILTLATVGRREISILQLVAVSFVCLGVIGLGFVEANEDSELRSLRQQEGNYKYSKSVIALAIPVIYCFIDALATFADSKILETLDEDSANCAYELTFLFVGVICAIYLLFIKKEKVVLLNEKPKYMGAAFETIGQMAYVYALADSMHVVISAPIISSYCVLSVIWSRIFLKEKLSKKHYLMIFIVVIGIVILGIFDA